MMSKVELIKQVTYNTLEKVFKTFDKGIALIPDDRLEFRPTQANMSAKEISYHVYQVALLLASATKKGEYNVKDLDLIAFDPDKIASSREIIQYGQKVKRFIEDTLLTITEEDMEREIRQRKDFSGFDAMKLITEEAIHHRGQLMLYLRLMEIQPPSIYDYT